MAEKKVIAVLGATGAQGGGLVRAILRTSFYMFQFKRDFNAEFCAARDLTKARALNPGMLTLDQWLAQNAERIPLE